MRRVATLVLAALAAISSPAAAQGRVEIHLGGGVTEPTGDFGKAAKLGWHGLGSIAWFPGKEVFAIQATGFYGQNKFDPSGGKFKLAGGLAELRLDLRSEAAFRPYFMLGGGLVNSKASPDGGGGTSNTKGALAGGVGLGYVGATNVGFFVEFRYVNVFYSGSDQTFIPLSAGLRIALGE